MSSNGRMKDVVIKYWSITGIHTAYYLLFLRTPLQIISYDIWVEGLYTVRGP